MLRQASRSLVSKYLSSSTSLSLRGHIILHSGGVAKDGRNTEKGVVAEDREVPRAPQQGRLDKCGRGKEGNEEGGVSHWA